MPSAQNNAGTPVGPGMPASQNRQRSYTEEVPWLQYPPRSRLYSRSIP